MEYDCIFPTRRKFILASSLLALAPLAKAADSAPRILVVGDSLSAEYGIRRDSGWVKLLQQRLADQGYAYQMQNASISGDTTSAGLSRLPAALQRHAPAIVILALGSNDALRGLPLDMTQANLQAMIQQANEAGAQVLLTGMHMPPNYGRVYAQAFHQMFLDLAQSQKTTLLPFLLEDVATRPELFQSDQLHPTEAAQAQIANNVWGTLQPLLKR